MNRYDLVKNLIEELDKFGQGKQEKEIDIESFAYYIINKSNEKASNKAPDFAIAKENVRPDYNIEVEISTLITSMFKYVKHYTKKALEPTAIKSIDEFGFLTALFNEKHLTKTELIQRNLMEIPSGNEIIRRLVKQKLLQESPDPIDRRSKLVSLSSLGRESLMKIFTEMHKVAHIANGKLSQMEKEQFLTLLKKLKHFHSYVHLQDKNAEIDSILKKYIE